MSGVSWECAEEELLGGENGGQIGGCGSGRVAGMETGGGQGCRGGDAGGLKALALTGKMDILWKVRGQYYCCEI